MSQIVDVTGRGESTGVCMSTQLQGAVGGGGHGARELSSAAPADPLAAPLRRATCLLHAAAQSLTLAASWPCVGRRRGRRRRCAWPPWLLPHCPGGRSGAPAAALACYIDGWGAVGRTRRPGERRHSPLARSSLASRQGVIVNNCVRCETVVCLHVCRADACPKLPRLRKILVPTALRCRSCCSDHLCWHWETAWQLHADMWAAQPLPVFFLACRTRRFHRHVPNGKQSVVQTPASKDTRRRAAAC